MSLKLSPYIRDMHKMSYAKEEPSAGFALDCSSGINPYGCSPQLLAKTPGQMTELTEYPHGLALKEAILRFWSPHQSLTLEQVVLTDGTMGGIYLINTLFRRPGAVVVGVSPQFPDYVAHAQLLGYRYHNIPLQPEEGYRIPLDRLLQAITPEVSCLYLDNPNNPTGQALPLDALHQLLKKAQSVDCAVIADEAYGEYMEESDSAATLLGTYENLLVLRTFSKGFGLAGLRAGYVLSSPALCAHLNKIAHPYMVAGPARRLAAMALDHREFLSDCRRAFQRDKGALRDALGRRLSMAHTLDACPIALLYHENPDLDLAEAFAQRGVLVYSGFDFQGLYHNSVRLRLPHRDQMPQLLQAMGEIGLL